MLTSVYTVLNPFVEPNIKTLNMYAHWTGPDYIGARVERIQLYQCLGGEDMSSSPVVQPSSSSSSPCANMGAAKD